MAAAARKELNPAEAARLIKDARVRAPKLDAEGKPLVVREGPDKGRFDVEERAVTADDILAAADYGDRATVVTIDGRRHEVPGGGAARSKNLAR